MTRTLRHNRAHDYPHLVRRWRALAQRAGLKIARYARAGGYDLYFIESRRSAKPLPAGTPSLYFSAGIHGDEVGATEGLLRWAEKNVPLLRKTHVLIFPCLNPWGLVNNCRRDLEGRDLNRGFHNDTIPQIAAQMRILAGRRFDLALTLHEDYDAHGLYIYEVASRSPSWAESLIEAAAPFVPADSRKKIEGRPARNGVIRASIKPDMMPDWPEAFALHFHHAERTFTVETPSEFFLDDRVDAQVAVLTLATGLCRKEVRSSRA